MPWANRMHKIIELKFGSHLYGTDTENSDLDLKAIYLPTAKEICLGSYKKTITTVRPKREGERNNKEDVDIEIFSLDRYLDLLLQGQTMALDFLFAPEYMRTHCSFQGWNIMCHIYANRLELLNRNVNAFVGYARQQAAKYGQKGFRVHGMRATLDFLANYPDYIKIIDIGEDVIAKWIADTGNEHLQIAMFKGPTGKPAPHLNVCGKSLPFHATIKYARAHVQGRFDEFGHRALMAEKNEGIDWKALSHAVRVNSEAQELLETGFITFPRPDRDLLLKIKLGQMPYQEVATIIEDGLETLKTAQIKSTLRESPNREWADDFIYHIYSGIVRSI